MTDHFDRRPILVAAAGPNGAGKTTFHDAHLRPAGLGYTVVPCFIGLDSAERSIERVAMRVLQGGHDVPDAKLRACYRRSLRNLARAVRVLPHVVVYDTSDLAHPFREVARFERGRAVSLAAAAPRWLPRVR